MKMIQQFLAEGDSITVSGGGLFALAVMVVAICIAFAVRG